ncbi:MAG: hypothetical protein M1832_002797 [Thelocarpon impressellum]|nr:MAG: hypothetical protein M1832_002797 [Thelocarpon impressellum]
MKVLLPLLLSLVGAVSARSALPSSLLEPAAVELSRRDDGIVQRSGDISTGEVAAPKSLSKRARDYNEYQRENPRNTLPDFVVANGLDGHHSVMYTNNDIWAAFEAGWEHFQAHTRAVAGGGRRYPISFRGLDDMLRGVDIGAGNRSAMLEYPLVHYGLRNGPFQGGGYPAGLDRVVFDRNGRYLGVITHRGMAEDGYHWARPTNIRAVGIGAEARAWPGIPRDYVMPVGGFAKFF